jgi:hypothetical protein
MDQERFKTIISLLERDELTLREKQFLEGVKRYFLEHSNLAEQQCSILEGVYREKNGRERLFLVGIIFRGVLPQEPPETSHVEGEMG